MRFLFFAALCFLAFALMPSPPSSANTATVALVAAESAPAQAVGMDTIEFTVTCGTTVTPVVPAADGRMFYGLTCWVDGTTPVFFGSEATTTALGLPVCEDTGTACIEQGLGIYRTSVRRGGTGCIVAATPTAIRCQGPAVK